jgi:predicted unusual protein kinase regulating ubiquinone biosynthesis (AarF/ABC1/UbiB family)
VLRAFSTLEGIGKALVPGYRFSEVARPYATELLQLQDSAARRDFALAQLQQQATELGAAAAAMPTRVAAISETIDQITAGDLKLRVRDLEGERAARRAGIMQAATLNAVAGVGLLNVGTQLALSGRGGAAGAVMAVAGAFGALVLLGLRRVQRLDKFEKDLRR